MFLELHPIAQPVLAQSGVMYQFVFDSRPENVEFRLCQPQSATHTGESFESTAPTLRTPLPVRVRGARSRRKSDDMSSFARLKIILHKTNYYVYYVQTKISQSKICFHFTRIEKYKRFFLVCFLFINTTFATIK